MSIVCLQCQGPAYGPGLVSFFSLRNVIGLATSIQVGPNRMAISGRRSNADREEFGPKVHGDAWTEVEGRSGTGQPEVQIYAGRLGVLCRSLDLTEPVPFSTAVGSHPA